MIQDSIEFHKRTIFERLKQLADQIQIELSFLFKIILFWNQVTKAAFSRFTSWLNEN